MDVFIGKTTSNIVENETYRFVTLDECEELPFPVVHQKIYQQIEKSLFK
jgi:A/G-specific adenine glycosylase